MERHQRSTFCPVPGLLEPWPLGWDTSLLLAMQLACWLASFLLREGSHPPCPWWWWWDREPPSWLLDSRGGQRSQLSEELSLNCSPWDPNQSESLSPKRSRETLRCGSVPGLMFLARLRPGSWAVQFDRGGAHKKITKPALVQRISGS